MQTYRLKLTALSPIHIGTGEVYEPTNFVIDDGYLYEFDEVLFYKSLEELDRQNLEHKLSDFTKIIDFYKEHQESAKKISSLKIETTKKIQDKYKTVFNKNGTKNKNQFEIHKTYKNPNTNNAVIPGSSIKGMLDTILKIYPQKIRDNSPRQELILSDSIMYQGGLEIGFSYRKHKNPSKEARSSIPQMVEIIKAQTSFIVSLKSKLTFKELQDAARQYYKKRAQDRYEESQTSFVVRVGKFSGKEYVTDVEDVKNSYNKPIATHTLYEDNEEFGWISVELIDEHKYNEIFQEIKTQEIKEHTLIQERQKEIKDKIYKKEQIKKEQKILREKRAKEEEERRKKEQEEHEAKLNSMSPLDKEIELLKESHPNPNETIDIIIFNAIKEGKLDSYKKEALVRLKEEMISLKKWVQESKKPQKDKKYKRTQEVIKMLEENS
jgi:CRISPR/Cas system CSM-associated protein Csm5 (group 7 of RAMP superfamily)